MAYVLPQVFIFPCCFVFVCACGVRTQAQADGGLLPPRQGQRGASVMLVDADDVFGLVNVPVPDSVPPPPPGLHDEDGEVPPVPGEVPPVPAEADGGLLPPMPPQSGAGSSSAGVSVCSCICCAIMSVNAVEGLTVMLCDVPFVRTPGPCRRRSCPITNQMTSMTPLPQQQARLARTLVRLPFGAWLLPLSLNIATCPTFCAGPLTPPYPILPCSAIRCPDVDPNAAFAQNQNLEADNVRTVAAA